MRIGNNSTINHYAENIYHKLDIQSPGFAVDGQAKTDTGTTPNYQRGLSLQYKWEVESEYERKLEDARINDPDRYLRMQDEKAQASVKSFEQLTQYVCNKGGAATFRGASVTVNSFYKQMSIGDTSSGKVIRVGVSDGWSLNFTRESIDDVIKMLDIFSPKDIKAIMEAITIDNMATDALQELEDEVARAGQTQQQNQDEVQVRNYNKEDAAGSSVSQEAEKDGGITGSKEASEVTTEIILKPDGSRVLSITVKVGETEMVTTFELSKPSDDKGNQNKQESQTEQEEPNVSMAQQAASAYESNFAYAQ